MPVSSFYSGILTDTLQTGQNRESARHTHKQATLSADSLDVSTGKVILGHDEFIQIYIVRQGHFACMNLEDAALRPKVWHRKFNFAVDTARAQQGRVKSLDPVRC